MEENSIKTPEIIDLKAIVEKLWNKRKLFYKVLLSVFIASCIYILGVPRTYDTTTMLAPEIDSPLKGGTISSLAASFGFDLSEMQTSDAITPLLYPDLMKDNGFVTSLFNISVVSKDGDVCTSYYNYLKDHQKQTIWFVPLDWIRNIFKPQDNSNSKTKTFSPYQLSKIDNDIANAIRNNVKLSVDKKTGIITISAKAQDALICKTVCDSVTAQLQYAITDYRTNKARTDYNYYKTLSLEAKQEYEKARQRYASFSDASTHISLRSIELKMQDLENDMQLKYNTYTTLNTQLQASKAKVQERTPAFTVLKGAEVPVKATGPKRMLFVFGMLILAFIVTSIYILVNKK